MEKFISQSCISCPEHPSFPIQAVNMGTRADKLLLCLKCMLETKDHSILSDMRDFPAIIKRVSDLYLEQKESVKSVQRPAEYMDLHSGQAEIMEKFSRHIEEEKMRTETFFNQTIQEVIRIITEVKDQSLKDLDEQVKKLSSNFENFENQLRKTFPSEDEMAFFFPDHETLEKHFHRLSEFNNLTKFVENVKKDLQEADLYGVKQIQNWDQINLKRIYEHISDLKGNKPHYHKNDQILLEFTNQFQQNVVEFFKSKVSLENPIDELPNFIQGSKIITKDESSMIQNCLPAGQPFHPKLIYCSSRDEAGPASFHKLCDEKSKTISLLKVIFDGSDKPCVIGGYLDAPWHSNNAYMESNNTFLFSITSNIKCPVNPSFSQKAAFGRADWGIIFGHYDLHTSLYNEGYVCPHSFVGTAQLVQSDSYAGSGEIRFQLLEVEVYSLE